jgi:hypothetical protein
MAFAVTPVLMGARPGVAASRKSIDFPEHKENEGINHRRGGGAQEAEVNSFWD